MTATPRKQSAKDEPRPTSAGWTAAIDKTKEIMLPSGYKVKIRSLSILEIAEAGHLDLSQTSQILKKFMQIDGLLSGVPTQYKAEDFDKLPLEVLTEENMTSILNMFRQGAVAAVVEPKVSFPPDTGAVPDGAMNVMKIPYEDLEAIWNASIERGPRRKLTSFRDKS